MANHAARTTVLGVREAMQQLGYPDESPKNIVALKDERNFTKISNAVIQSMFGMSCKLVKRSVSLHLVELINIANSNRELSPISPSQHVVVFDSQLIGIGVMLNLLETTSGSTNNIKEDIAIQAGITEEVVDQAVKGKLLPRSICQDIQKVVQAMSGGVLSIKTLSDADTAGEVPPKEVRATVLEKLNNAIQFKSE